MDNTVHRKTRGKARGLRPLEEDEVARLTVHGAAGEVTGSCFLVETRQVTLLVDCGLIQGARRDEARNARRFPFDPAALDAVVLTHAHIDHSGRLPKLVKDGFRGKIHCTSGTADLLGILLPDSAHIQEGDARQQSRRRLRQGRKPLEPLYTALDAQRCLEHRRPGPFDEWIEVGAGVRARFRRAGHILGAASVELEIEDEGVVRRIVFSGDVGRTAEPVLRNPDPPEEADVVLLESTYGDRDHRSHEDSLDELAGILAAAAEQQGNVIVPVFAVGRAQEVLLHLGRFEREERMRARPVYLDSPMAISVTELYARHLESLGPTLRSALDDGQPLGPRTLNLCRTPEQSMALNGRQGVVILSASGMCNAGRVVHHLKHNLWRPDSHVVITGFQARGTIGRALVDGARSVRVAGERVVVKARVHTVGGLSAHGGQSELVNWSSRLVENGAHVVLVHGEPDRRAALRARLESAAHHPIRLPESGAVVRLLRRGPRVVFEGPEQAD